MDDLNEEQINELTQYLSELIGLRNTPDDLYQLIMPKIAKGVTGRPSKIEVITKIIPVHTGWNKTSPTSKDSLLEDLLNLTQDINLPAIKGFIRTTSEIILEKLEEEVLEDERQERNALEAEREERNALEDEREERMASELFSRPEPDTKPFYSAEMCSRLSNP